MSTKNSEAIVLQANIYISNINRFLKDVKSEVSADFIHFNNKNIIIITSKAVAFSDLSIVEEYIKEFNNIDLNNIIYL